MPDQVSRGQGRWNGRPGFVSAAGKANAWGARGLVGADQRGCGCGLRSLAVLQLQGLPPAVQASDQPSSMLSDDERL
jgi:hypothetical protein